jgi:cytochrome P450
MTAAAPLIDLDLPSWPADLYSDEALTRRMEIYRELRDLGPVVRLPQYGDVVALPRYAEVRAALENADVFCSGQGVSLSPTINKIGAGASLLMSDGELHRQLRLALTSRLSTRKLRSSADTVTAAAERLVDELVERGSFDAVADLAVALPTSFVPDLIGWPHDQRENLLAWAAATFEMMGPENERLNAALPIFGEMNEFACRTVETGNVLPGSIADDLLAAARRGEVPIEGCPVSLIDYLAPSLDTTISALSSAILLFAENPDQWDLVRADPSLIPSAFDEVVRLTSPATQFAREVTADTEIGGTTLPAGTRVLVMFSSANRDERHWDRPDEFDVRRDTSDMVAFGFGVHQCAGQGLARMEGHALFTALAARVARFEAGQPVWALNNSINSLASLPVTIHT